MGIERYCAVLILENDVKFGSKDMVLGSNSLRMVYMKQSGPSLHGRSIDVTISRSDHYFLFRIFPFSSIHKSFQKLNAKFGSVED